MGKPKKKYQPRVLKGNVPSVPQYSISIKLGDKEITSAGSTVAEAVESLVTPIKITTKGLLTVQGNGKSFERLFTPVQLKRFFWPIGRKIQAKMLESALK